MKYPHVESYRGFQIVVGAETDGNAVRVSKETVEQYGGRVAAPFSLQGARSRAFGSEAEACEFAAAHAKGWIDALLGKRDRTAH